MNFISFPINIPPTIAQIEQLPRWIPRPIVALGSRIVASPWTEGLFLRPVFPYMLARGEAKSLGKLMQSAYADMRKNPVYRDCKSAVAYCLASRPHKKGQALVYAPKDANSSTPVLLLLNGYGGNLLYFPWAIQKELKHCILVAPSWEIDWTNGPVEDRCEYIRAAMDAASAHLNIRLQKPWLCALSQGGPAAFELAGKFHKMFQGIIAISTCANSPSKVGKMGGIPVRMIHGSQDEMIPLDFAAETIQTISRKGGDAGMTIIKTAGHFLLLSHRKALGDFLREVIPRT